MEFTLNIKMNNAAFGNEPNFELARILTEVAKSIRDMHWTKGCGSPARDLNDNTVGQWDIEEEST